MGGKVTRITYYITLILFCGAMSFSGFVNLTVLRGLEKVEHLGYQDNFPTYIGICKLIGVVSMSIVSVKLLKKSTYGFFFILLSTAIYSHLETGNSASFLIFPTILLILLVINCYCYYAIELKKKKNKHVMYMIYKKIKDNDVNGEMADYYSDAG
jgi:hypothetical protein